MFVESSMQYDVIHDFSVWLKTGSKPADIIGFEAIIEIIL